VEEYIVVAEVDVGIVKMINKVDNMMVNDKAFIFFILKPLFFF